MIEQILQQTSPKTITIACVLIYTLVKVAGWLNIELKIRALGGHAPKAKTWLPWGITSQSSGIESSILTLP
jgi:hypothetical protein